MSQLVDSTGESDTGWRRHTDPPNLWLNVVTGSILLHALAILSVQSFVSLSPPLLLTPSVPVDLIDVNPTTVASSQSIRNPRTANKQGATGRSLYSPQNISPARSQTARNSVSSLSPIASSTRSPQQSRVPNGDVPSGFRRSRLGYPFTRPFTTPSPNSTHSGTATGSHFPGHTSSSKPSRPTSPSHPTPPSDSQGGKGFVMAFTNWSLANGGKDIPDSVARPKSQSQIFDTDYPAKAKQQFGKAVKLKLTISDEGDVTSVTFPSGFKNDDYAELVKEQLLYLHQAFVPAKTKGTADDSNLFIFIELDSIKQK